MKKFIFILTILPCLLTSCNSTQSKQTKYNNNNPTINNVNNNDSDVRSFLSELLDSEADVNAVMERDVNYDYSLFELVPEHNDLFSLMSKDYEGINDKTVTLDYYHRDANSKINHPNVGMGLLLYRAIKYKLENPTQDNEITVSSFHFSIIAGINLLESSPYYGTMKNMPNAPIDRDGFVRFSYLMVIAAKLGIKINIISQIGGYSNYGTEIDPSDYFYSILDEKCYGKVGLDTHKVSDYMNYASCDWVSYGGKSASDMYHIKTCAVEHYINNNGNIKDYSTFFSSSNLDGINYDGSGGHASSQTGTIITNHEYIYRTITNFTKYAANYCRQDDSYEFRCKYINKIKEQREYIKQHGYTGIKDEMMIYLGTDKDNVFELYLSPLDSTPTEWSDNNPLCKYVDKLYQSDKYIKFMWHNPKVELEYEFYSVLFAKVSRALRRDRGLIENLNSELVIKTDESFYYDFHIQEEKDVGRIVVQDHLPIHEKDLFFSYEEDGKRHSTVLLNSMNMHRGSYFYQTNQLLVLKETEETGFEITNKLQEKFR